jgi:hypothetical protein
MSFIKIALVVVIAVVGYNNWRQHNQAKIMASASTRQSTPFVALPAVRGQSSSDVLIFAAENCPYEAAQRADRLAAELSRNGLRVVRIHQISFDTSNVDQAEINQLNALKNGELPIVFLHGRGKANPTLQEVLSEYNGTSRRQ